MTRLQDNDEQKPEPDGNAEGDLFDEVDKKDIVTCIVDKDTMLDDSDPTSIHFSNDA